MKNPIITSTMPNPQDREKGYVGNIEMETWENSDFRRVLYTGAHCQLVVMCIPPDEEIGLEVHEKVDQFIRVETGEAALILGGEEHALRYGSAVVVPAGTPHNVVNVGAAPLKLYTVYSPANHPPGTVHHTKTDAERAEVEEHQHAHAV